MGLIAGPDKPPVMFPRMGRRVSVSIAMPSRVLMRAMPSAPPSSTALAMAAMSVTFGVSLTMMGNCDTALTARVTLWAARSEQPKSMPPSFMLGDEMLSSRASMPSRSLNRAAMSANSRSDVPAMLTMRPVLSAARGGTFSAMNASMPGLVRPMALSMPDGVSAVRGGGLPARG